MLARAEDTSTDRIARILARNTSSDTAANASSIRSLIAWDPKRPIERPGPSVLPAQRIGATPTRRESTLAHGRGDDTNDAQRTTPRNRSGACAATEMATGP